MNSDSSYKLTLIPGLFNTKSLNYGSDPFDLGQTFTRSFYSFEFRFRDCIESSNKYITATKNLIHPMSLSVLDMEVYKHYLDNAYIQERELFCFLFFGLSALETLVYGLFFMVARFNPNKFPIKHQNCNIDLAVRQKAVAYKEINFSKVTKRLFEEMSFEPLSKLLCSINDDKELINWRNMRNEFTHRHTPQRHSVVIPPALLKHSKHQQGEFLKFTDGHFIRLDEKTTEERLIWLEKKLESLIEECYNFIQKQQ